MVLLHEHDRIAGNCWPFSDRVVKYSVVSENGEHGSRERGIEWFAAMKIDENAAYLALSARDRRFDGVFFVGVGSTGIYCRPVCPARTPMRRNCRFFGSAEAAEKAGYRPCLRCRPELAPGNAPVDQSDRIARLLVRRLHEGILDEGGGLEEVAAEFGMSSRHLRRVVKGELGVSPVELVRTRRLLLAKQLLTETRLPVTEIAFASGFSSLRRYNDAFLAQYRMPPTRLRKDASGPGKGESGGATSKLQLGYRPPYDWQGMLDFLRGRAIRGVERVTEETYARTVRIGGHEGWVMVSHAPERNAVVVEFAHSLNPVLPTLLSRLRDLFDLNARPDLIAGHLGQDRLLKAAVAANPGLRVPGAFDGFELAIRAILGQQVTVKAATTLAGRFAAEFGEPIETPFPELGWLSPRAEAVAAASVDEIARLGIVSLRARTLQAIGRAFASGGLRLDSGGDPEAVIARLVAMPGIGPWTANHIAMRALRWPDAFPKEDIAVRKALGGVTARQAEELSQAWRPWRSYAVLHLWRHLAC
jgi:AraC family transcriptional regulator of adaptative response / DNA-3-methyladenine glycosylase II